MESDSGYSRRWQDGASKTRAWIQCHPALTDLLIPVALAALTARPAKGLSSADSAWLWVAAAGSLLPLIWRRRYPIIVFAVVMAAALSAAAADFKALGPTAAAALLVALFTVAAHKPPGQALAAAVVFEAWAVAAITLWAPADAITPGILLITGTGVAALMTGVNTQTRRAYLAALEDRAARLEREQDQQARLAVAGERTRIAREVHDIVTHSLSVMVALADGAGAATPASPERAQEAMHQVAATGRQAIGEMRRMVGTLRIDEADAARYPVPGLTDLDDLLTQVRAAGLPVRLIIEGQPYLMTAGAQLAVYRIAQESLTNIRKHALEATCATVRLTFAGDGMAVEVADDGRHAAGQLPGAGHGITGMRERAAAYGGTVEAGPVADGGWRVRSRLGRSETEEPG
jgi:signal transduction histidine kinase